MTFEFQTLVSLDHAALHVAVLERPRLIDRRAHDITKIIQHKIIADREVGEALRERLDPVTSQPKISADSEIPKALGERPQLVIIQAKIPSELQRPELLELSAPNSSGSAVSPQLFRRQYSTVSSGL